ncbi:uncharacterized protein LOC128730179 [Anopheles nili]|uniref:uncharacterized protein LOC128730179 n=1 Tax=Anopheles nili TaxID=185578 RepID=UPI00237AA5F4|nr:uncharacterized protein LOC128730179 [Anopheles nili]
MEEHTDLEKQQSSPKSGGDLPDGLILVSSGSENEVLDEDHEEGEIQDEDEEEIAFAPKHKLVLEDISSEEESNIRERMAALEAMDKKFGLMQKAACRHKYDYLDVEDVMNGKENFYCYYPHKQPYRSHKSHQTTAVITNEVDQRHVARHGRSISKRHVEKVKEKQSKRSAHKRRKRRKYVSRSPEEPRRTISSDSEPEAVVDREILKIACGIESGKSQRRSQSGKNPLKKKLFIQQSPIRVKESSVLSQGQTSPTKATDVPSIVVELSSSEHGEEEEDEELQLRLLALSTKPIVRETGLNEIISDFQIPSPPPPPSMDIDDGNTSDGMSAEENQLRIFALKTAMLKKHATRQKRKELEQPYSPSDDIALSPVREVVPVFENDVYSNGRCSDDIDSDVEIIEPQCDHIELEDTDDGGHDMEISPVESPLGAPEVIQGTTEDSQQPIDMELVSSEDSSQPSPAGARSELETSMLLGDPDSCDSSLFQRRDKMVTESPPDSMEEAEADALRHLLLTKMRQKQNKKNLSSSLDKAPIEDVQTAALEEPISAHVDPVEEQQMQLNKLPSLEGEPVKTLNSAQAVNPNLITLVDRKVQRKRRKKSLSNSSALTTDVTVKKPKIINSQVLEQQSDPSKVSASVVRTQKLVNNPNKLINLNHNFASSSPTLLPVRTESPKELIPVDTFVSRPVPKLVIQLGESDSDSDVDFDALSPSKADQANESTTTPPSNVQFEEQLERFLKSVRSKSTTSSTNLASAEKNSHPEHGTDSIRVPVSQKPLAVKSLAKKIQSTAITMNVETSTAVKHLPKSAQMEYSRLVARMAQLEQHKLSRQSQRVAMYLPPVPTADAGIQKVAVPMGGDVPPNVSPTVNDEASSVPRSDSKSGKSPGRRKQFPSSVTATGETGLSQDPVERKLHQLRSSIPNLSEASRNRLLATIEKHFEKHSGVFLNELEKQNATIREAQQERRDLYQIDNRIDLLREKLNILERVRERQRHRSVETFTSLERMRRKILTSRKRSSDLKRMCCQIGYAIVGNSYQLPSSSQGDIVQQQLRVLIAETQKLKNIRKPTLEEFKNEMVANQKRKLQTCEETWRENDEQRALDDQSEDVSCIESEPVNKMDEEQSPGECFDSQPKPVSADSAIIDNPEEDQPSLDTLESDMPTAETGKVVSKQAINVMDTESIEILKAEDHEPIEEKVQIASLVQQNVILLQEQTIPSAPTNPTADLGDIMLVKSDAVSEAGEVFRFGKYSSPLVALKQGAQNIPTGIICPYELGGQCVDRDCKFEHFGTSHRTP